MADDQQTGSQAPAGEQPQVGNAPEQQTTSPQTPQQPQAGNDAPKSENSSKKNESGEDLAARFERMERELADTRKEAANYRTKARELDKLREDEATAKLSEVEKERKRAEKAEQALTSTRTRIGASELKLAAREAGIIDPDDAIAHLAHKLTYDSDGEPENVADLVKGLKQAKPHLFGTGTSAKTEPAAPGSSLGATNPTRQSGPLTVTATQYMDAKYKSEFRAKYGKDLMTALRLGEAKLV